MSNLDEFLLRKLVENDQRRRQQADEVRDIGIRAWLYVDGKGHAWISAEEAARIGEDGPARWEAAIAFYRSGLSSEAVRAFADCTRANILAASPRVESEVRLAAIIAVAIMKALSAAHPERQSWEIETNRTLDAFLKIPSLSPLIRGFVRLARGLCEPWPRDADIFQSALIAVAGPFLEGGRRSSPAEADKSFGSSELATYEDIANPKSKGPSETPAGGAQFEHIADPPAEGKLTVDVSAPTEDAALAPLEPPRFTRVELLNWKINTPLGGAIVISVPDQIVLDSLIDPHRRKISDKRVLKTHIEARVRKECEALDITRFPQDAKLSIHRLRKALPEVKIQCTFREARDKAHRISCYELVLTRLQE